jgi:hypothetical protein
MYRECGLLSAILSHQNRSSFSIVDLEKAHQAPLEDKAKAFETYLSYGGKWDVDWTPNQMDQSSYFRVTHTIQWSLTPYLKGIHNQRFGMIWTHPDTQELKLHLRYQRVAQSGTIRHYHLLWHKNTKHVDQTP